MNAEYRQVDFIKQEWASRILPAFKKAYAHGDFPKELMIIPGQLFDGFGAPGLVAVDEAVAFEPLLGIRLFALAHETAHCVTYLECEKQNITTPNTDTGLNKHKHEMMADLIAIHVLTQYLPRISNEVKIRLNSLAQKLGAGDAEHPSGYIRVQTMNAYYKGANFETLFLFIATRLATI
ncbi:MAG: hypothetical protein V4525_12430 [Pseudomonadota bacterium]